MTNPTPHGQVPAIQRYKIGYRSDEWGVRSSTPSGIPDASGSGVRYADHVTALAAGQATAAQAVVPAGWKLVPVDATDEMVRATDKVNFENGDTDGTMHNVWNVMIAAAPATQQPEGDVVAYLDVGANGYLDLGSELSEDALQQLPKGRHALVIAGTYGIAGYVAALQPAPATQQAREVSDAMVLAALQVQYPATYSQYLRHPADGPKTSIRTEAEIDTARRMIAAALAAISQPSPTAQAAESAEPAGAGYAALPDAKTLGEAVAAWIGVETRGARNWVDTTVDRLGFAVRSVVGDMLRASHGQASSQAGEYPALVCDYCGALTPDPWHSSGMLHGKMSKHIHSCDACAARGQAPAQPDCLTCNDHGAVGNILTAEPCPDCTRWNVQPAQADSVQEDAARLDWLALAGPTSICLVIDQPHDGEVEVATDDITGYGKTLREAIDAAMNKGGA